MGCIFHKWEKWSKPEERTLNSNLGDKMKAEIQIKECSKCGKTKWRFV